MGRDSLTQQVKIHAALSVHFFIENACLKMRDGSNRRPCFQFLQDRLESFRWVYPSFTKIGGSRSARCS